MCTDGDRTLARAALGELCQAYWYPLYAFARRQGLDSPAAEDATQAFFASILETNFFASADAELGRLRSYLLTAFRRDLDDARRSERRWKRGGKTETISLDLEEAERRFLAETEAGEAIYEFEIAWAKTVLELAVRRVERDYAGSGRESLFRLLRPYLGGNENVPLDPVRLRTELGLSGVALRQAISRLRDRFRTALRAQIADTLREPTDAAIDDELHALRAVMARNA